MNDWQNDWLIGAEGLHHSPDGMAWQRVGSHEFNLTGIIHEPNRLVVAAGIGSGLWEWPDGTDRWIQMHDETLTEVLAIARIPGDPGIVAGSPYGISTAQRDETGAPRWTHHSDDLRVNERFTNAILVDPHETDCWLVGTEAGLLIATDGGKRWERTSLSSMPVRTIAYAMDSFWAGTDDHGIWRSADGLRWDRAGYGMDEATVYDLAEHNGRIIAGTRHGIAVGDGQGRWERCGPHMLTSAVAMHPEDPAFWLAGASPGGLWRTNDAGVTWHQIDGFKSVLAIIAPGGTQS